MNKKYYLTLFFIIFFKILYPQNNIDSILDAGFKKDQFENSQKAIENAQNILNDKSATDKQKIRAYYLMNGAYSVLGESKKAIESAFKAKKIADKIGSKEYSALSLGIIGENYRRLNLYDEASEYFNQALTILNDKGINSEEVKFRHPVLEYEMGNIEYLKKNNRAALNHYNKAIELAEKIAVRNKNEKDKKEKNLSSFYLLKGHTYLDLKKIDSAEIAYNKAQEITVRRNDKFMMIYLLKSYGDLNFTKGDYQNAIDSAKKAEKLTFFNDLDFKASLYNLLAKSYAKIKNYEESEKYYKLVQEVQETNKEVVNSATSTAFSEMKKDLNNKTNSQKRWKQILEICIPFITLLSCLIIYLNKKKSQKDKVRYLEIIKTLSTIQLKEENSSTAIVDLPSEDQQSNVIQPKKGNSVSKEVEINLLKKLDQFEKSEKFIKKNITIASLSSQLGTNTNYLSEVINKHKNKNFNTYINELRIQYIIHKIHSDSKYHQYKVSYLAEECGLPYSSFVSVFKNFTGMTPSAFIKQDAVSKKRIKNT